MPYGFGLVDLQEGLRVVSRLTSRDLAELKSGIAMRLMVDALFTDEDGVEVLSWAYTPESEISQ